MWNMYVTQLRLRLKPALSKDQERSMPSGEVRTGLMLMHLFQSCLLQVSDVRVTNLLWHYFTFYHKDEKETKKKLWD